MLPDALMKIVTPITFLALTLIFFHNFGAAYRMLLSAIKATLKGEMKI